MHKLSFNLSNTDPCTEISSKVKKELHKCLNPYKGNLQRTLRQKLAVFQLGTL